MNGLFNFISIKVCNPYKQVSVIGRRISRNMFNHKRLFICNSIKSFTELFKFLLLIVFCNISYLNVKSLTFSIFSSVTGKKEKSESQIPDIILLSSNCR